MKVRVNVTLKTGVLDTAGKAVLSGLHALGYDEVRDVRLGKLVELDVDAVAGPEFDARIRQMSDRLLANTVIEDFTIELGD